MVIIRKRGIMKKPKVIKKQVEELNFIEVVGAREHNLKNISIRIPKKSLVVVTGVSGSGKSSLVFDTVFAEGQRRYVESLSSYARQFLGQLEKPKYDTIRGLSPTIAIEQKAASKNPRSTVGTITEVSDYLRVLYDRVGVQHCINCGKIVGAGSSESIVKDILKEYANKKISILAPLVDNRKGEHRDVIAKMKADGFLRARVDGVIGEIDQVQTLAKNKKHTIEAVIDRLSLDASKKKRLNDSVELALKQGKGKVIIHEDGIKEKLFNTERTCCGIAYPELEPTLFSFNSPKGMCETCHGIGSSITIDPRKVIVDENLSIADGAIKPWESYFENGRSKGSWWGSAKFFPDMQRKWGLNFSKPWKDLGKVLQHLVLYGSKDPSKYLQGAPYGGVSEMVVRSFKDNQEKGEDKDSWADKYIMYTKCEDCHGTRLNPIVRAVTVNGESLPKLSDMSIKNGFQFITDLKFAGTNQQLITEELLKEIKSRLGFLVSVGLDYLSLSRAGNTLSGGEAQRIRLASQIGSELTGVLYVLDEPSIGLHQKDNQKLIDMLKHLRDIGNSVLVVEHDEETMMDADYLIDIGPGAGKHGGYVVAEGTPQEVMKNKKSMTGRYLSGIEKIEIPTERRTSSKYIEIQGAKANNLKNIDVKIPLETFTCITGVSGAGKSTLINRILFPAVSNTLHHSSYQEGAHKAIKGLDQIDKVINIDQRPIGKTPRSNPATYTKLFDHIRDIFASLPESKSRGYEKGRYSFNVKGGRCETCQGAGSISVEMHFLPDVLVVCDTCHGKRFNEATLEVKFKGHSISDVLDLPVDAAVDLFENQPKTVKILKTIQEVGLGYISLGQSATTLSGGESQRIKLSRELAKRATGDTLYILDEPTTGLHFEDIKKLLKVLHTLVDKKNSVVVIEHNLDVIKTADHLIDIGPKGGAEGGYIIAQGRPEEVIKDKDSFTGQFLAKVLK
jgi:excinuclease ABC subunit A